MKAIRVNENGGPEVMRLEDVADPRPGAGEVLVRVRAAGVNPVDTYLRAGTVYKTPLPYTPGFDGGGDIEALGEGVTKFKPGDRVYIARSVTGTYAEKTVCRDSQVYPLPAKITYSQGAAVNVPYATAYRALFQRAHGIAGETVFVHGASGGVGVAAVQIARAAGFTVIGTGGTERGRELALKEGAHRVLDHHDPTYTDKLMEFTGGRGVDIILEMAAHINLGKDLTLLARNGRVVVIGNRGPAEIDARNIMGRDGCILGMNLTVTPQDELDHIHPALVAGLENGTLRPVVGQEIPLAGAPKAHEEVMKPGAYGKIVLVP